MPKDIKNAEEYAEKLGGAAAKRGGNTSFKDYLLIALITLVAVIGINSYIGAGSFNLSRSSALPPVMGINSYIGAGSAGGGCGGCGASGGSAASTSSLELERLGLEFYLEQTGETEIDGVQATVQDFGCHQEIYIYKAGVRVMRIGHSSGRLFPMP